MNCKRSVPPSVDVFGFVSGHRVVGNYSATQGGPSRMGRFGAGGHDEQGIVIPLAKYTLEALADVEFSLCVKRPVERVESVHRGRIDFRNDGDNLIRFSLPLEALDDVKIYNL